jgi:hypothetical protein
MFLKMRYFINNFKSVVHKTEAETVKADIYLRYLLLKKDSIFSYRNEIIFKGKRRDRYKFE